jgi:hypothetical protein
VELGEERSNVTSLHSPCLAVDLDMLSICLVFCLAGLTLNVIRSGSMNDALDFLNLNSKII